MEACYIYILGERSGPLAPHRSATDYDMRIRGKKKNKLCVSGFPTDPNFTLQPAPPPPPKKKMTTKKMTTRLNAVCQDQFKKKKKVPTYLPYFFQR